MVTDPFEALRDKYVEMRAMRIAADAGEPASPERMRALAERFPGALREIDELPMETIDARIEALSRGERPGWAITLVSFHAWMRVALRIKRRFGRDARPEDVHEWLAAEHRPGDGEPPRGEIDLATIANILRPPGARISRWVLERIARDRGLTIDEAAAEAFLRRNA